MTLIFDACYKPPRRFIPTDYAPWLWLFSFLLLLRVLGQLVVVVRAPRWLPRYGPVAVGLPPYPVLLLGQVLVLSVMFWICADFSRGQGMFVQPYPGRGNYVVSFSYLYFGGMVLRYVIWMWRRPGSTLVRRDHSDHLPLRRRGVPLHLRDVSRADWQGELPENFS